MNDKQKAWLIAKYANVIGLLDDGYPRVALPVIEQLYDKLLQARMPIFAEQLRLLANKAYPRMRL